MGRDASRDCAIEMLFANVFRGVLGGLWLVQATPQDMQEETCIICQDIVLHKWNRKQPCCSAWMHKHCALELPLDSPCPHCRRAPKRRRPYDGPAGREEVGLDDCVLEPMDQPQSHD